MKEAAHGITLIRELFHHLPELHPKLHNKVLGLKITGITLSGDALVRGLTENEVKTKASLRLRFKTLMAFSQVKQKIEA